MPATLNAGNGYSIPFDEELFAMYLENQPDLVSNAFVNSGIIAEDGNIATLIANGGNAFTIPFWGDLDDTADDNYDGQTDITLDTMGASSQTGTVYGRAHGWFADYFVADFTVANPLMAIAERVAKYWQNKKQARLIGMADAVLGVDGMSDHVVSKATLGPTTLSDTTQEIWGDRKGLASFAVMHSAVAQSFEDMERVDYLKYTDSNGVERGLNIYLVNGITTIVDDGVPKTGTATDAGVYTLTIGGTPRVGDKIIVNGKQLTLDATSAASTTAAATALKTLLGTPKNVTLTREAAVITFTEKSGFYGTGKPTAKAIGGSTVTIATTTAPASFEQLYTSYLFQPGAFRHAPAPVAHPVFKDSDELKRGGVDFFGNRFREALHPNGFSFTLPQNTISPTDEQLATDANWALAYGDHRRIPFAKLITPGHKAA